MPARAQDHGYGSCDAQQHDNDDDRLQGDASLVGASGMGQRAEQWRRLDPAQSKECDCE